MSVRGVVTRARRPAQWHAPGPAPETPRDRADVWPDAGEVLCHLVGDWRILQRRDGHRWSLDDLVTAWFATRGSAVDRPARIADLGSGIGAVLLMLAWKHPGARCVGFEAQEPSTALARRSILWNGVASRCEARTADLRDLDRAALEEPFDLVTGTPPYLPLGSATTPRRAQQAGCHLELRGGIEHYCKAARALAPAGRFVVCHSDLVRTERAADAAGLAIDERLDVIPRAGKPRLFTIFSMMTLAKAAAPRVCAPLVVRDSSGQWTPEFRALRAEMGMPTS